MAEKIDLKRTEKAFFSAPANDWSEITLPPRNCLMIDGQGSPGDGGEYQQALAMLYPLAYAVKFHSKLVLERDYAVPPLEGLWWADDPAAFANARRDEWCWTLLVMVPSWINAEHVAQARLSKPSRDLSAVRLAALDEGLCLQTLHKGSFASEAPKLHHLHHGIMPARGLTFAGHHHEIYLSDPRRTAPGNLRTILRQPVRPIAKA